MSLGIPAICSPVGMNKEVIREGENGFFASSTEEWFEKIQLLIKNPGLRKKMGLEGRKTVEEKYSVNLCAPVFVEVLEKAIKR
jgi:glycosyltransferase involved in cell wall biosynthesis